LREILALLLANLESKQAIDARIVALDEDLAGVQIAARPEFGDYQANGVMSAAKRLKTDPRRLARDVVERLDLTDLAAKIEVAGPGFINITVRDDWLARELERAAADARLGVSRVARPQTVVADYSSPNLAKEMHVGHLRSTIIGDAVVRALEFLGHRVVRQNHVGDWGTQFGMLIAHMVELMPQFGDDLAAELADLERFYREAKQRFDSDAAFAETAREYVVRLQSGDSQCRDLWRAFIAESLHHCEAIYARLGVTLSSSDLMPESAYTDDLPVLAAELEDRFGKPPTPVLQLVRVMALKPGLRALHVVGCDASATRVTLHFAADAPIDGAKLAALVSKTRGYQLTPEGKLIARFDPQAGRDAIDHADEVLRAMTAVRA